MPSSLCYLWSSCCKESNQVVSYKGTQAKPPESEQNQNPRIAGIVNQRMTVWVCPTTGRTLGVAVGITHVEDGDLG